MAGPWDEHEDAAWSAEEHFAVGPELTRLEVAAAAREQMTGEHRRMQYRPTAGPGVSGLADHLGLKE